MGEKSGGETRPLGQLATKGHSARYCRPDVDCELVISDGFHADIVDAMLMMRFVRCERDGEVNRQLMAARQLKESWNRCNRAIPQEV